MTNRQRIESECKRLGLRIITLSYDPSMTRYPLASPPLAEMRQSNGPTAEDEAATVEKIEETGFHRTDPKDPSSPLFVYDYFIKGFLKGAGSVLKDNLVPPVKQLKSRLDDFVFVFPRRVLLGKTKPDGVLERPLRAMTMQGPRVTLARSDYVDAGTEITWSGGNDDRRKGEEMAKSADEMEAARRDLVEPGQKAVEYLEEGMNVVLRSLGIDTDGDIKAQQVELGVHIIDGDEALKMLGGNPELEPQGFYVMKDTGANQLQPIAYVGDAGISHGHIVVRIHDFRTDKIFEVKGIRMPEGRRA